MKIHSRLPTIAFCFLCVIGAIGQAADREDIKQINVVSDEWINYTNKDGSGAYWEVVKAVFEPLNITVNTRVMPWARAERTVKNQQADALLGSYYQADQLNSFIFPKWHIGIEDPIIALYKVNNGVHLNANNLQSLQNKRIIWVRGYEFDKTLFSGITINKHVITKPKQALIMLNLNRADVLIDYEQEIRLAAKEANINLNTTYKMHVIKKGNKLYLAFSNTPRGRYLSKIFDQQMESLASTGAIKEIYAKWGFPDKFTD